MHSGRRRPRRAATGSRPGYAPAARLFARGVAEGTGGVGRGRRRAGAGSGDAESREVRPGDADRPRQGRRDPQLGGRSRRRADPVRSKPQPHPAAQPREALRLPGHRPHPAHSRHLRPPRPHARRQTAGRAGAVDLHAAAAGRTRRRDVAAGRRHRHPRSRRNAARNRPPPHWPPHREAQGRNREGAPDARAAAQEAQRRAAGDDRAGRLHQRRQINVVQCADSGGRISRRPHVRNARPDHPRARSAFAARRFDFRYGRVHPRSAAGIW